MTTRREIMARIEYHLSPEWRESAEAIGWHNLLSRVRATREPDRRIRPHRMPWHQKLARLIVFCLMWLITFAPIWIRLAE